MIKIYDYEQRLFWGLKLHWFKNRTSEIILTFQSHFKKGVYFLKKTFHKTIVKNLKTQHYGLLEYKVGCTPKKECILGCFLAAVIILPGFSFPFSSSFSFLTSESLPHYFAFLFPLMLHEEYHAKHLVFTLHWLSIIDDFSTIKLINIRTPKNEHQLKKKTAPKYIKQMTPDYSLLKKLKQLFEIGLILVQLLNLFRRLTFPKLMLT